MRPPTGVGRSGADGLVVIDDPIGFPWELARSDRSVVLVDCRPLSRSDMGHRVTAHMVGWLRPTDLVVVHPGQRLDDRETSLAAGRVQVASSTPMTVLAPAVRALLAGRRPHRIGLDSAAVVLDTVSEVLGRYLAARGCGEEVEPWAASVYQPVPDGSFAWSGWGGPSRPMAALGGGRWFRMPLGTESGLMPIPQMDGDGATARAGDESGDAVVVHSSVWGLDTEAVKPIEPGRPPALAGIHLMVDRLVSRRADRLRWFAGLWEQIVDGGFLAFTLPIEVAHGGGAGAGESAGFDSGSPAIADYGRLIEELLEATAGRILSDELVVHRPPGADDHQWVTLVLRRLGHGTVSPPGR